MQSNQKFDTEYVLIRPDTTVREIELLCKKAISENVFAVCVPPLLVEKARQFLDGSAVKIATVIAYPLGFSVIESKLAEIIMAMVDGVDELDVVVNITALKNNDWQYLATELNTIMPVIRNKNKTIKIVVESSILTDDELKKCCDLYGIAGVDFLCLSTGYHNELPGMDRIRLVRTHLAENIGIKVSGRVTPQVDPGALSAAGAGRIGHTV